ncbi:hypothetical protein TNCV_1777161 [Trichonephila clavipes]|nr:hypothetical protein TNCV_1777161 [Trichonephila clavipes]
MNSNLSVTEVLMGGCMLNLSRPKALPLEGTFRLEGRMLAQESSSSFDPGSKLQVPKAVLRKLFIAANRSTFVNFTADR